MIYITEDFRPIKTTEAIPLEVLQSFLEATGVPLPRIVLSSTGQGVYYRAGELSYLLSHLVDRSQFLSKFPAGNLWFIRTGSPLERFRPNQRVLDCTTPAIARELLAGWEGLTPRAGSFDAWQQEQVVKILTPIAHKKPLGNRYDLDLLG